MKPCSRRHAALRPALLPSLVMSVLPLWSGTPVLAAPSSPLPRAAASAPASPPPATSTGLSPCRLRGVEHDALCGTVQRPLDPSRPQGSRIAVHYAVLPALSRHKRPDPLFFFAGGPGQSAIDLAGTVSAQFARLLNRRDIVLIDQRGTGRSAPLQCDADEPGRALGQQVDPQRMQAQLARCREALQRLPHGDLRFFTTLIAVQDAEAVRQALGAERINLAGGSYGTRAALEYQRQFPQRVRRAVLDGVAPPDMVLPASSSLDNQAALEAVFNACAAEAGCAARHPQLRAQWRRFLDGLPRTLTLTHPVTGRRETLDVTRDVALGLVRPALYVPVLAAGLPLAIDEAAQGRLEPLAALASALQARGRGAASMAEGMHFSVVCSEDVPLMTSAVDAAGADFGRSFASFYERACAAWPRAEVPGAFRQIPTAATPTLLLSGGADPATPPRHGERVARALGARARHIVVPHAGHGVMAVGCMSDVLYRFLDAERDEDALAVDARCATEVPRPLAFAPPVPPAPAASAVDLPPPTAGARR